ncbi:MAG TPA: alpha/beta hydrolase, partial [Burkholderiaceae bacterium]
MQSHPARDGRPLRLILLHGLASTPREFGFLQHPLRRQGVKLEAPEVAGYSAGSLAARPRWRDWVAAAGGTVEALARASDAPFMLGGLCTGAMLALAVAGARPLPGLRGLALMSPLFAYDGWGLPWWYRLRGIAYATGLAGRFSMAERTPYGLKNERMRQLIRQQLAAGETSLVGPARVPLSVVRESERLSRHARALLPGLRLPTLVQHAREDEVCSLASVQRALHAAPPSLVSLQVLEDSYHMIPADNDRHAVADRLAACLHSLGALGAPSPAAA